MEVDFSTEKEVARLLSTRICTKSDLFPSDFKVYSLPQIKPTAKMFYPTNKESYNSLLFSLLYKRLKFILL